MVIPQVRNSNALAPKASLVWAYLDFNWNDLSLSDLNIMSMSVDNRSSTGDNPSMTDKLKDMKITNARPMTDSNSIGPGAGSGEQASSNEGIEGKIERMNHMPTSQSNNSIASQLDKREQTELIATLQTQIAIKDSQIAEKDVQLAAKDAQLAAKDAQIAMMLELMKGITGSK